MKWSPFFLGFSLSLLLFLGGCTSLVDTMDVQCEPQPMIVDASKLSDASRQQLEDVMVSYGIEVTSAPIYQAFRVEIERFDLNLEALYHEPTSHNIFRNIEGSLTAAAFDHQTGDLLWEKDYDATYTLKSDPHFYSQNQLALAQAKWALQRDLFTHLSSDLTKLCAIQTSGFS